MTKSHLKWKSLTLTTKGPPLSPSQESLPVRPAHKNWLYGMYSFWPDALQNGKKSGNERWWNGNGNQLWKLEGESYLYIFSHCLFDKMGTWKTSSNIVSAPYEVGLKHHSLRIEQRMKIISPRPPWEQRQASIFPRFFPTLSRSRSCEIISCKLGFSWYFLSAQSRSHSCIRGSKFLKLALIYFCFTHLPVKKAGRWWGGQYRHHDVQGIHPKYLRNEYL